MTNGIALLLLELALKSTAVVGIAFLAVPALKRLSAEERHLVWVLAVVGLLVLPAAAVFGPTVELPLRSTAMGTESAQNAGVVSDESQESASSGVERSTGAEAVSLGEGSRRAFADPVIGSIAEAPVASPFDLSLLATALYITGTLLLLAWFGSAAMRVAWSLRRLEPVTDPAVLAMFAQSLERSRLRRKVRLVQSPLDATPWAWGLLHPVVVVPESFAQWPEASRRNAFVHELSHVARLDFLTALLGYLCCALYWVQPLAWLAIARMKRESEQACDDRVLTAGGSRTYYAAQLLEIARSIHDTGRRPILGAAMASSSSVSQRIASILDIDIRRRTVGKIKVVCSLMLTAALVLPIATLESQEDAPDQMIAEPADAEFIALVQRGPSNSEELGMVVRTLVEHDRLDEATDVMVDYLSRDDTRVSRTNPEVDYECAFCNPLLETIGPGEPEDIVAVILSAFDEIEEQAYLQGDGNRLIRLAEISRASKGSALERGLYYLSEGFRVGNLADESKLAAVEFLSEMGWYEQARSLVAHLNEDESSSLYHSAETQRWFDWLDRKIDFSTMVAARLIGPGRDSSGDDGDYLPLFKVSPFYPAEAAAQGREGSVVVEFRVTDRGRTSDVTVVNSTDSVFDRAAVWAASQFLYLPRIEGGVPVDVHGIRNRITFVMDSEG